MNTQKPFLKWVGGKTQLLQTIILKIPKEINNYHELFLGGGSVLLLVLSLQKENKITIKNKIYAYDINQNLINVYKHIQSNKDELYECIDKYIKEYDLIIVPVISPYDEIRQEVRSKLEPNFHLVYLKSDIQSLRLRDTKGLYLAADKGLINNLIGYSKINPYDEPSNPEIIIETGSHVTVNDSKDQLLGYINKSCL